MRKLWAVPVVFAAALAGCGGGGEAGSSDAAADGTTILYVAHFPKDCVGAAPMKCLQVRESLDAEWTLLYQDIEGFDYEPGFDYELRVRKERVENPPADGSSIRYVLEEVVSRTPMSSEGGAGAGLLEGEWTFVGFAPAALEGAEGDPAAAAALLGSRGRGPTIAFEADGAVSGFSGCNRFTGTYEVEGGHSLSFSPLASTRRACPPPLMEFEGLVLAQLEKVEGVYVRDGEMLELYGPDETLLLTFRRAGRVAAGPQVGEWELASFGEAALAGAPDEATAAAATIGSEDTRTPTLALDAEGGAAGYSGCNRFTGRYASDGKAALSFGPVAGTMMACTGPAMHVESLFVGALQRVAAMAAEGDRLELRDGDGGTLLRFRRVTESV